MFVTVLVLLAGGVAVAWWARRAHVEPPFPSDIKDAEVRHALERARQEVVDNPRSETWGLLGMLLLAHLFDREANFCFVEATRLDPADPRWPYCRGLIALKRDPDNALPFLRQAAAGDSWPKLRPAFRLQLAEALLERHELAEAEVLFEQELRRQPGSPRAALGLGLIAGARGEPGAAEKFFQIAKTSACSRKTATAQLAASARAQGNLEAAESHQREAARLPDDQTWPDPLLDEMIRMRVGQRKVMRQVDRLEKEHKFAEAADVYLSQIKDQPTARAYVGAGLNLARLREYERALPLLREGVRLDPEGAQAHYTLALAIFSRAERAWQQNSGSSEIKGWFREVVQHAEIAAELKPDHASAYLFWGLALKYLGEPATAAVPLRKGVACRPEMFELQLALGEALLETGARREAETHLENARRLDPSDRRPARALERLRMK